MIKTVVAVGGLGVLGVAGWQAASWTAAHQECERTSCLVNLQTIPVPDDCCTDPEAPCCKGQIARAAKSEANSDCCELAAAPAVVAATTISGWATVKGQIIFGGAELPKHEEEKVTSDQGHCLAKGPILNKVWDVDPSSKGVANIVVFILPERNEELPVHESYAEAPKPFVLDQPYCVFTPRVFAVRKGQTINAKNPDPVSHNVVVKGIKSENDQNIQIAPGAERQLSLVPETNALAISCGSHPWMRGYAWCFDHPYFAVTDKEGKFEIKNVPAGARKVVIWHETGYLTGYGKRDAKQVTFADGETKDLGQVTAAPKQ